MELKSTSPAMTTETDRLWQAFQERAQENYYEYIPYALAESDLPLAADLRGLINDLAGLRGNALTTLANARELPPLREVHFEPYTQALRVAFRVAFGDAEMTIHPQYIRLTMQAGAYPLRCERIDFTGDSLRRYCEEHGLAPRLDGLIRHLLSELNGQIKAVRGALSAQAKVREQISSP